MIAAAIFLCLVAPTTLDLTFLDGLDLIDAATTNTGPPTEPGTAFANRDTVGSQSLMIQLVINFFAFFLGERCVVVMVMPEPIGSIAQAVLVLV
jgi:hypothetical protein